MSIRNTIETKSQKPIACLKFDNSSSRYVFAGQGNNLILHNTSTGAAVLNYETFTNTPINCLDLLDTDKVVSGSDQILIHDKVKAVPLRKFETVGVDHRGKRINDIKVLSDNGLVMSCDMDLRIWDLRQQNKFKPVQEFSNVSMGALNTLDSNQHGVVVSCGGNDGRLYTFDLRSDLLHIDELPNTGGMPITTVRYHHDYESNVLLVNVMGRGVQLFDSETQRTLYEMEMWGNKGRYRTGTAYLPSRGLHQFVVGSENGVLHWHDGVDRASVAVISGDHVNTDGSAISAQLILSAIDVSCHDGEVAVGTGTGVVLCLPNPCR